jgi:hypothetical protein
MPQNGVRDTITHVTLNTISGVVLYKGMNLSGIQQGS